MSRAIIVRNSWVAEGKEAAGFIDAAELEKLKNQGDAAIKTWINKQLDRATVTVGLVGLYSCSSKWIKYEIEHSEERGNGLLGIDVSKIKDLSGNTTERCGKIPVGCKFYLWNNANGYQNLGNWIQEAAIAAGK